MKILAFDLATTTGYCFGSPGETPECRSERLGQTGEPHAARFSRMLMLTRSLIDELEPDRIVVEQPIAAGPKGGADRILLAAGLRACVMGQARIRSVRLGEFSVGTIRKHFIGSGRMNGKAAKAAVMEECRRRGWRVETHDQSDAAALWDLACAKSGHQVSPGGLFSGIEREQNGEIDRHHR